MWPKIQVFFSAPARPIFYWWLVCFSLMAGLTIRNQYISYERMVDYATASLEEVQYELILKMRDEQELKERYLWLVQMTSLGLRDLDTPKVPRMTVSIVGDN